MPDESINVEFSGFFFYIGGFVMKINIQNLDQNLFEINGKVGADFLEKDIRGFYPNEIDVHVKFDRFGKNYKWQAKW